MTTNRKRLLLAGLLLFTAVTALALPPIQGECQTRDTDSGTIFCGVSCRATSIGSSCNPLYPRDRPAYCWQATMHQPPGGNPACHEGSYDECCDTTGGF